MAGTGDIPTYSCGGKYRGCAIIIVNKNFWVNEGNEKVPKPEMKRKGSSVDLEKMKFMFNALDFKVKLYKDLTADTMKDKIYKASQNEQFNEKSDSFALVISSHGDEVEEKKVRYMPKGAQVWRHRVQGSDSNFVYIDDMLKNFQDDKAKGLKGKPKLFFIQACRSRHGTKFNKRLDYGVNINVTVGGTLSGVQPSDAGDHGDDAVLDSLDALTEIEDIYRDCSDDDEEEWKSEQETGASDDEDSDVDSDDLSDAKGGPDSGYMPPSPDRDLPQPVLPSKDDKVPVIPAGEPQASGSQDIGKPTEAPGDEADVRHSQDTGVMPPSPFDIVPINCPEDCLLVYPVTSGNMAFRRADLGSRLLHCMHKEENLQKLVRGGNLLQYLTAVSGDMAKVEIRFKPDTKVYTEREAEELKKNMPFKVTTIVSHRLQKQVLFEPKSTKSIMAAVVKQFKKLYR